MISSWEQLRRPTRAGQQGTSRRRRRQRGEGGIVTTGAVELERGESLYRVGDAPEAPYLVLRGALRVMVPTLTGRERLADIAGVGDVLGASALDGTVHAESVVAADAARVAVIDLARTLENRQGRGFLSSALVRQLTRSRELADDLGLPMGARICRILARLAERLGTPVEMDASLGPTAGLEWRHLPFNLTHDDVALLAGCARVTATRILGELKDAQVLEGQRGNYAVVPSALEAAADRYVYEVI